MDQRFILNALAGKEWIFGKHKHKVFSANIRFTYQGGFRYTPIDYEASGQIHGVEGIDSKAYSLKLPNSFTTDLTLRYRINKKKTAHEFSFMILNATGFKQTGYIYNLETNSVERKRSAPIVPSISWKMYF
jgi:outer membrane receptor protein involved in Fe transport